MVEQALPGMTSKVLRRFSSREGYELYADTLSTRMFYFLITTLVNKFKQILLVQALETSGIRTGLVSNCDAQMRAQSLSFES